MTQQTTQTPNAIIPIAVVNNVEIEIISKGDENLVPIKPICEALGIVTDTQVRKIKNDEILSSVTTLRVATGADGKQYEMTVLPLEYVFGWLFTISPSNVKEEAREAVSKYRHVCYRVLYEYFTEPQTFLSQKQKQIEHYVGIYKQKQKNFRNARFEMNEAQKNLNNIMAVTIDDWRNDNKQLFLDLEFSDETEK